MNIQICNNYDDFSCSFGDLTRLPGEAIIYITELRDTNYSHCHILAPNDMHFLSFGLKCHLLTTIDKDNDKIRDSVSLKKIKTLFKRYKNMKYIESFGNGILGGDFHEFLISSERVPALVSHLCQQEQAFGDHSFSVLNPAYDYLPTAGESKQISALRDFMSCTANCFAVTTRLAGWLHFICFDPSSQKLQELGFEVVFRFKLPICYDMSISTMSPFWAKKQSQQMLSIIKKYKESMERYYPFIKDNLQ